MTGVEDIAEARGWGLKCLVTGAAGFIGSHLSERLVELGYQVVGLDCFTDYYPRETKEKNLEPLRSNPAFTFVEGDILTEDLPHMLEDIDYVFHEAAQAGVRASWGQSFEVYTRNNVLATQTLLEAIKKSRDVRKFIYASSSSIYGNAVTLPVRENAHPQPISPYGVTKLAGELLCHLYWKSFGIPVVILRYFTAYGPRQRPDMAISKFISAITRNQLLAIYGGGEQTRDFTYVSDVVEANVLAMQTEIVGEAFNIGGGSCISVNELIGKLESFLGRAAQVDHVTIQKGDVTETHADVDKARRLLGYWPSVSIDEGLRFQIHWAKTTLAS